MTELPARYRGKRGKKTAAAHAAQGRWEGKLKARGVQRVMLPLSAAVLTALDDLALNHALPGKGHAQRRAAAVEWLVRQQENKAMKLFLLRAKNDAPAFNPWYDKAFGLVVRADSVQHARQVASQVSQGEDTGYEDKAAWLDETQTTCVEIPLNGEAEIILMDIREA